MNEEELGKYYMHIDNGGLMMRVKSYHHGDGEYSHAELEIENMIENLI